MDVKQAMNEIRTKPVVRLWPTVGVVLNLGRGATYQAAERGEIATVRIGRSIRAITAPLRKSLGIDAA